MNVDFAELFRFTLSPLELLVRASLMFWFVFAIFRFVLRRNIGSIGIADVLLLVLVADASQNAMAGSYKSVVDGMLVVGTLVAWAYLLDWASYRWPLIQRFVEAPPLQLIRHGRLIKRNLDREKLSLDELKSKLREQGIEDLAQVKNAWMEGDGQISVIRVHGDEGPVHPPRQKGVPPN